MAKDRIVLGRQATCDVPIPDHAASRAHAEIRRDGKLYTLVDLGSRNGTSLNGRKVSERQLAFGDTIAIGPCQFVFAKEAGDVELKDLLSKYEIVDKIGEGGMGIVYKAVQRSMARTVALKILAPKYAAREKFVDQFIKEARAAGALNHPNIIQVHDVGSENGIHYFSMEFVEGATCMQLLRSSGALPVADALEIVRQTAKALEYAHGHRLIHQDIKPDNIMVGQNNAVKLADLGISKTFDEAEAEAGARKVMGTPHYMAPEAALGKKIDHRVDIYALGATLYHLLTGKTPYHGTSPTDVLKAQVMEPVPPVREFNPEVPAQVADLVGRMMAKKPEERPQTAAEVHELIQAATAALGLATDRPPGPETMILRRLAKRDRAPGADEPGPTPGLRTRADTTGEGLPVAPRRSSLASTLAIVGVVIAIIIALIVLVPKVLKRLEEDAALARAVAPAAAPRPVAGSAGPAAPPEPAPPPAQSAPPAPQQPAPAAASAVPARLGALEQSLRQAGPGTDVQPLLAEIEALRGLSPSPAEAARIAAAASQIDALLERRRTDSREAQIAGLDADVRQLLQERNYDLALRRIDAVLANGEEPRLAQLKQQTVQERDRYLKDLGILIDQSRRLGDAKRLKALRDGLPPGMLGTEVETRIQNAIQEIRAERAKADREILAGAQADLGRWNAAGIEQRIRIEQTRMDEDAARQLADMLAAAKRLGELAGAIKAKLAATGQIRFAGRLGGWSDPDLLGAEATGLQVRAINVPSAEIRWTSLKAAELAAIADLVLGKEAAGFKTAIETLGKAQAAAGK